MPEIELHRKFPAYAGRDYVEAAEKIAGKNGFEYRTGGRNAEYAEREQKTNAEVFEFLAYSVFSKVKMPPKNWAVLKNFVAEFAKMHENNKAVLVRAGLDMGARSLTLPVPMPKSDVEKIKSELKRIQDMQLNLFGEKNDREMSAGQHAFWWAASNLAGFIEINWNVV
jgi:hypothetical protein